MDRETVSEEGTQADSSVVHYTLWWLATAAHISCYGTLYSALLRTQNHAS